jgi:hypothetical protein
MKKLVFCVFTLLVLSVLISITGCNSEALSHYNQGKTFIDNGNLLAGGKAVDKFQIRIWNDISGTVYDNQLGALETTEPVTNLEGRSIVIHK